MQLIRIFTPVLAMAILAGAQTGQNSRASQSSSQTDDINEPLDHPNWLSPFVSTPAPVVEAALDLARVGANDLVYDLGSGDGRIILAAAQRFKARSAGIEWNQSLCEQTLSAIERLGLQNRVKVIQGDIFNQDLSTATVVTGYLMPKAWERLAPILQRQLKKGARVVSINDPVPGWRTAVTKQLTDESTGAAWKLYLYRIE